jgi:hypothetical protein
VLPAEALALHGPELAVAALVAAGDEPARCRASVLAGWSGDRDRRPTLG